MAESNRIRSDYAKNYRRTPIGAAGCAWNRLTSRSGAKYGHRKCYRNVEVRMTRAEFIAWAVPQYEAWFREHPAVTPSVDRIRSTGHYELGNLQLIPVAENRLKNSRHKNKFAPEGTHWCCRCQSYLSNSDFYSSTAWVTASNPLGLSGYCKKCQCKKCYAAFKKRKSELHSSKKQVAP